MISNYKKSLLACNYSSDINLHYSINKPVDFVFDCLSDMDKFVSLHPVINRVHRLEGNNYLVAEILTIGFVPFSFTYPANITTDTDKKIITMDASVMGVMKIEMNFLLKRLDGLTLVEEEIHFKSWLPVKW
jgi:carbon monoxide dehydrogenase subunit G